VGVEAKPSITRRRVAIDFDPVPPSPWFPAGGPLEVMFNAASLSFPPTERFFIQSVRDYQDRITDPQLMEQVRGFIHQEAMHNKVHLDCNAMLARDYERCHSAERVSLRVFKVLGILPRALRLSLSSAMEHFTAMAADTLLQYPHAFRQVVPRQVADMWLWHAVEETEHKAVCFDVHDAVIGRGPFAYLNRIVGMLLATPIFLFFLMLMTSIVLRSPKSTGTPVPQEPIVVSEADAKDAARFIGKNMFGLLRELIPWRLYFDYYRPSFHPWNHDNAHYIDEWKALYPGFGTAHSGAANSASASAAAATAAE
jgi:predicted metal-dependent hydrolase